MRKLVFLIIFFIVFCGCSATYKYNYDNPINDALQIDKKIAIATSEDGAYSSKYYYNSGKILSRAIKTELTQYSNKIVIFKNYKNLNNFESREIKEYDYIIIPEILHWEDRATEWSGIPDKIKILIEIYNSDKELLKSVVFDGTSSIFSSKEPSVLLDEPLKIFFKSVFETK